MKRIRSAAWALCLLWALLLCAGAYAEAFPALGVPAPDAARPPALRLEGARLLRFLNGETEEVAPGSTDAGAYLLGTAEATLTLAPEQTAALSTLEGEAVDLPKNENGSVQLPVAQAPLRLTLSAPEQEAQSWLLFFTAEQVQALCDGQGFTWTYAPVEHVVRFTDAEGTPVAQVFVNVCTDTLCTAYFSDANGEVAFPGEGVDYVMHVLQTPEGYAFEAAQEVPVPAGQVYATVVLEKK